MVLALDGSPPFELPLAKNASAEADGEAVCITVRVMVEGRKTKDVHIPITVEAAQKLSVKLRSAIRIAKARTRREG